MSADSWAMNGDGLAHSPEPDVTVLGREMVLPASRSPPYPFFLPCLDIFWQDIHYNRRLLFYPHPVPQNDSNGRLPHPMQQLKSSLALCLVHYHCWCGRLAKAADPPHRLYVECNDAGVEFVEASIDMPLTLLAQDGFQMKPFFDQLCQRPDHKGDCLYSSPLLSVQATLFSDGGLAIGVAQSHIVADGQSLWDFMVSWGECSRGVPLSLPPVHDRQRLAVPYPSPEKATWSLGLELSEEDKAEQEELAIEANSPRLEDKGRSMEEDPSTILAMDKESTVESMKKDDADVLREDTSGHGDKDADAGANVHSDNGENGHNDSSAGTNSSENGGSAPPKPEPLVQWMFTLSASAIKKLKSEAGEGYTSFEVTCAHFWQRTTIARGAPTNELTYLFMPINCRNRIAPPLPRAYFGNVIGICMVLSITGKVSKEPLCATASRIHNKLVAIKADVVEAFMHWLEIHDNRIWSAHKPSQPIGKGLNIASSPRFPAYRVDFGWGKPAAVRAVKVTGNGELVFFGGHPGSQPGDVEICTALPPHVMKHLLEDPEFLAKSPSCASALC